MAFVTLNPSLQITVISYIISNLTAFLGNVTNYCNAITVHVINNCYIICNVTALLGNCNEVLQRNYMQLITVILWICYGIEIVTNKCNVITCNY